MGERGFRTLPHLFSELKLRGVKLPNRIGVSPMCEYSCVDGYANDWHFAHLASRAVGGAGLLLWPGDGPIKLAVAAGMAATLARSLAKLNQERRRAAGDVRGAALMDIAQTIGGFAIGAGSEWLGWTDTQALIIAMTVLIVWAIGEHKRS